MAAAFGSRRYFDKVAVLRAAGAAVAAARDLRFITSQVVAADDRLLPIGATTNWWRRC
jgi:hypothetical protein